MMTQSRHYPRAPRDMKNRLAAVLLLAGAALASLAWTGPAFGQAKPARVGILTFSAVTDESRRKFPWMESFRRTLADRGWIEGKNVSFEYRSARDDPSQFAAAAVALAEINVNVIMTDGTPALRAAAAATRTIPIVAIDFTSDPIAEGYAESYAQPGGNVTGVFLDAPEFAGKWFELLRAIVPDLSRVAVLWDPGPGANHLHAVRSVAGSLDIKLQVHEVRKPDNLGRAFSVLRGQSQAVIILPSPMIYSQSERLAKLALDHRLPATSMARAFADAGGIIAYGPDARLVGKRIAVFVAKNLDGRKPAELPVERPTTFRLVVNLKTAKALGITIPQSILLRADEVIK